AVRVRPRALGLLLAWSGNLPRRSIGNNGDPLLRLQPKTHLDRVAGARHQFRVNWVEISAIGHDSKLTELLGNQSQANILARATRLNGYCHFVESQSFLCLQ